MYKRQDLSFAILSVPIQLSHVADSQAALSTSPQELTGDWMGYGIRSWRTTVKQPVGLAPTQLLEEAIFASGCYEAFRTPSSKIPHEEILGVFPEQLQLNSYIDYSYVDSQGQTEIYRIP